MSKKENKINPMRITDEKGNVYELDFSRETIRFAEGRGFDIDQLLTFPQTNIPAFWFYAFRKNHKDVARKRTDEILDLLGGLKPEELERLVQLYNQPTETLISIDGEARKNSKITVEL